MIYLHGKSYIICRVNKTKFYISFQFLAVYCGTQHVLKYIKCEHRNQPTLKKYRIRQNCSKIKIISMNRTRFRMLSSEKEPHIHNCNQSFRHFCKYLFAQKLITIIFDTIV